MKILIDSYNTINQNKFGGMQTKIKGYIDHMSPLAEIKKFYKWTDIIDDYDIIHIFMASSEECGLVKYAKGKKKPIVVSSVISPSGGLKVSYNQIANRLLHIHSGYWMQGFVMQNADYVITETNLEKKFICKHYHLSPEKVVVIPNAVAPPKGIDGLSFSELTGITGKFILQVGRFDPNKNQLRTIQAVNNSDMQLVLIGGPDKDNLSYFEQCKAIAGANVHFLGWVDHDSPILGTAFRDAQTLVIPSQKEIFGNSMFEAGIHGTNLVVTSSLPLDEWAFEKYCLVVNPTDSSDIRNKLKESYEMPKNIDLQQIIIRDFSWEYVTRTHMGIYKKIVG